MYSVKAVVYTSLHANYCANVKMILSKVGWKSCLSIINCFENYANNVPLMEKTMRVKGKEEKKQGAKG